MIRIGTAGWSYEDWVGIVYPKRPPRGFDRLELLASLFDTNEINSTFYRIPPARMARDWAGRVAHNPRFAFTAKLYRGFTHEREGGLAERTAFLEALEPLAADDRLGCVLAQFPVSFHNTPDSRERLRRILEDFSLFPLAAEFRHRSWDEPDTLALLTDHRAAFVNIDQPWLGENLRATSHVTAPAAYYRFHGRNAAKWFGPDTSNEQRYNYLYSDRELEPWVSRIREAAARLETPVSASGREASRGVYAILNNHFRGQAVANAIQLQNALTGTSPQAPETLRETYPALRTVTTGQTGPGQSSLFGGGGPAGSGA